MLRELIEMGIDGRRDRAVCSAIGIAENAVRRLQ
jgi:hypothetical protein